MSQESRTDEGRTRMNASMTHDMGRRSRPLYRITFTAYVVLTIVGCIGLLARMPLMDAATIIAFVTAPAFALSMAYHTAELPRAYLFVWITGILIGGSGIAAAVML